MLQYYRMNQRLFAGILGLLFVWITLFLTLDSEAEDGSKGAVLAVTAQRTGEDRAAGEVRLAVSLPAFTHGRAVALLLTLEASEGWVITGIAPGSAARGLTLTAGETGGGTVSVLLDGKFEDICFQSAEDGEDMTLLQAELRRDKPRAEGESEPNLLSVREGSAVLYCLEIPEEAGGGVSMIPISVTYGRENTAPGTEDTTHSPEEPTRGTQESGETEAAEETEASERDDATYKAPSGESQGEWTPSVPEDDRGEGELPEPRGILLGCQETAVQEGIYAVRFLFSEAYLPVVCVRGGGVLRLEAGETVMDLTECAGSMIRTYTFRGLSEAGEYEFRIYTREGVISVLYSRGRFLGFRLQAVPVRTVLSAGDRRDTHRSDAVKDDFPSSEPSQIGYFGCNDHFLQCVQKNILTKQ